MAKKTPKCAEKQWNTLKDLAEKWQVTAKTVRRYIRSGKLHACKIGGGYRISPSSVQSFEKATRIIIEESENAGK